VSTVSVTYGEQHATAEAAEGELLGAVVARMELALEQRCGGRGTCGKCKVLIDAGAGVRLPDELDARISAPARSR
jgi:Na+-transporting NADH:ubiquinone oxidoreductase subunit NqrF